MDTEKFEFILGKYAPGEVANIRFMDSVDAWSASSFVDEFNWLEDVVRPSKIRILINTEGGSVLRGMNVFSAILNSSIPTECVVEGLAASMGSIILAAGDTSSMRDYGIIMIHNPFSPTDNADPMVQAFQTQLKTIYKTRWGFSDEQITSIMDGEGLNDGTFLNADAAIECGIMSESDIIKTTPQQMNVIEAALKDVGSKSKYVEIFALLDCENKQINKKTPTLNKEVNNKNKQTKPMEKDLVSIAATLGVVIDEKTTPADIISAAVIMKQSQENLVSAKAAFKIEKAGLETSLGNVKSELAISQNDLTKAQAELKVFVDAKAEAEAKAREQFIDVAITAGKISAESKQSWIDMAKSNFATVKSTIDNITGTVKISAEINDANGETRQVLPEDVKAETVAAVVGKDFAFTSLNND